MVRTHSLHAKLTANTRGGPDRGGTQGDRVEAELPMPLLCSSFDAYFSKVLNAGTQGTHAQPVTQTHVCRVGNKHSFVKKPILQSNHKD